MKCIILAAGRGTRMGALTDACPKPMLPINGRPKLAYTIETLPDTITEVIIVVGYLKEQIIDYFGDTYAGRAIQYVEQTELNGTAGAVALAKEHMTEKFLVINGDDLYRSDDLVALAQHELGVLAYETQDQNIVSRCGVILRDTDGRLTDIVESPHDYTTGLINTGTYVLPVSYFDYPPVPKSPGSPELGLPQTVMTMTDDHVLHVVQTRHWLPIGAPEDLQHAQAQLDTFL